MKNADETYVEFPAGQRQYSQHADSDASDDKCGEHASDDVGSCNNQNGQSNGDTDDDT